jgi:hypothetical protein
LASGESIDIYEMPTVKKIEERPMSSKKPLFLLALLPLAAACPAQAGDLPGRVGQCVTTAIKEVGTRLGTPGSGSAVSFETAAARWVTTLSPRLIVPDPATPCVCVSCRSQKIAPKAMIAGVPTALPICARTKTGHSLIRRICAAAREQPAVPCRKKHLRCSTLASYPEAP